jgi:hypothetical protein
MAHALLLDLDDTLLRNSMKHFLPNYFDALTAAVSDYLAGETFLYALYVVGLTTATRGKIF